MEQQKSGSLKGLIAELKRNGKISESVCRIVATPTGMRNATNATVDNLADIAELLSDYKTDLSFQTLVDNPMKLNMFAETVRINKQIEKGIIPNGFIHIAECKNCGKVLLSTCSSELLDGCPWCFCPASLRPVLKH